MAAVLKLLFLLMSLYFVKCDKPGVQMRLTKKGMNYAVDVGIKIMQKDLKKKVINDKGRSGDVQYSVSNLRISKATFSFYELIPISGTGMKGKVSGISINAAGKVWYRLKKGWVSFSDTIGLDMKTKNIHFDMTLIIGADKNGRPTIAMKDCSAGVNNIDLHFHGSASWIYNIFSGLIESKLKSVFRKLLCTMAEREINTKAKEELATFPVNKILDKYALIDYALIQSPTFTSNYMDIYLKGEFKSRKAAHQSHATVPSIKTSDEFNKMVYFWVTDYTINSAGAVYHKAGRLSATYSAWDKKTPSVVRKLLNTVNFGLFIPAVEKRFPNAPMSFVVCSYKAPEVIIQSNKMNIYLYAHGIFKAKDKNSKINNLFGIKFDITTTATVDAKNDHIIAKIISFDYNAKVEKSYIGKFSVPLNSPFMKALIDATIVGKANPILQKGFSLPKVDEVSLENFDIKIQKNVIRLGSDIRYVNRKK